MQETNDLASVIPLYQEGYDSYTKRDFARAAVLFSQLLLIAPLEPLFWKGLAAAHQMGKNHDEALRSWAYLSLLTSHDPEPHIQAAVIYFERSQREDALQALETAGHCPSLDFATVSRIRKLQESC